MRTLTAGAIAEIAEELGTEPLNIVEVCWTEGSSTWYADKDLTNIPGKILTLSAIDNATTSKSTSTSFTVTLDDTDGTINNILNNHDVHKAKCTLYQYFGAIALTDKFVLFQGELSSPIIWNEGDRTVTFTALSTLEEREIGFSPEEGDFDFVSPDLEGQPWPLVFGNCLHVPAQKVKQVTAGSLAEDVGIVDTSLLYKLEATKQAYNIQWMIWCYYGQVVVAANDLAARPSELIYLFAATIAQEDELLHKLEEQRRFVELERNVIAKHSGDNLNGLNAAQRRQAANIVARARLIITIIKAFVGELKPKLKIVRQFKKLLMDEEKNAEHKQNIKNSAFAKQKDAFGRMQEIYTEYRALLTEICQQNRLVKTSVTINGGYNFVQNTPTDIVIGGARWRGTFNNNVFTFAGTEPIALYKDLTIGSIGEGDDCDFTLQMSRLDNFWLSTYTNLKGHYLKVTSKADWRTHIIKVVEQDGLKCRFQLINRSNSGSGMNGPIISSQKFPKFKSSFGADVSRFIRAYNSTHPIVDKFEAPDEDHLDDAGEPEIKEIKPIEAEQYNIFRGILSKACMRIIEEGIRDHDDAAVDLGAAVDRICLRRPVPDNANDADIALAAAEIPDAKKKLIKKQLAAGARLIAKADRGNFKDRFIPGAWGQQIAIPPPKNTLTYRINREEFLMLLNLDRLLYYEGLADVQIFLPPDPRDLYTIIGPDIKEIKEVSIVPLSSWMDNTVLYDEIPTSAAWSASVGSDVRDATSTTEILVANILPSTIKSVAAYRTIDNRKVLQSLPTSYYTKNESEALGDLTITSLKLLQPLSFYDEEQWEDTIYVSLESSVGPKIVNILKHIIETYTDKTWDATSFGAVDTRFGNLYPANFALFNRENAVKVLHEIAWQARCAIFEIAGVYHLKYLSSEPSVDATFTESDIESNTLTCELTPTEGLTTKFVAKWREHYLQDVKDNKIILRNNTVKYGVQENEFDFYIFNIRELVEKSATFWLIRLSNTWKNVQFNTFFKHLELENYDTLDFTFGTPVFANNGVRGVIQSISIDTNSKSLIYQVWLPVRAGEMGEYEFAWPGDTAATAELPFEAKPVYVTGDIQGE